MNTEGARALKAWRNGQEMTQERLAKLLHVSQGMVAHLEDDATPSLRLSVRIRELTGIDPALFLRSSRRAG